MDNKKILIVDDEPDILRLASLRLKMLGYNVLTAIDGKEGLDVVRSQKPDLVLLDLFLPIMNGADVCKKIKNDENLKYIPVILFTAGNQIMTAEKAQKLGADDYVTKPFDPAELVGKVEKILAQGVIL